MVTINDGSATADEEMNEIELDDFGGEPLHFDDDDLVLDENDDDGLNASSPSEMEQRPEGDDGANSAVEPPYSPTAADDDVDPALYCTVAKYNVSIVLPYGFKPFRSVKHDRFVGNHLRKPFAGTRKATQQGQH